MYRYLVHGSHIGAIGLSYTTAPETSTLKNKSERSDVIAARIMDTQVIIFVMMRDRERSILITKCTDTRLRIDCACSRLTRHLLIEL